MSLKTAKDYLDNYKKNTALEYINACTFLELLVDFEQSSLEEVLAYLNLKSFPHNTNLYMKRGDYINPRAVDDKDCQSTCSFFDEIEKTTSFSVITGFSHEIRERYASYYFSLSELFQSNALYNISFIEKYAAHQAMGKGYCYISKISIGNLFRPNDLVAGLPKQRMDELLVSRSIVKVKVDSSTDLTNATDMQKIAVAKIHEYMDAQMEAYNSTPTHRDEISSFINSQSSNNKTGLPTITQTEPKTDKERIAELEAENDKFRTQLEQHTIEVKSTDKQSKNHDSEIVVYLAFILAQKLPKYRKSNLDINAKQIGEAITSMAQALGLDKDDMHGFKRPDARLRTLINNNKELLSHFENLIKDNEKN